MDWFTDPSQFEEEFQITPLNEAIIEVVKATEEILGEMKFHLENNQRTQFKHKTNFLSNRISQLMILANAEDNPDITKEEVDALCEDALKNIERIDFNKLFGANDGEEVKHGLDIVDYLKDDDPFDSF